MLKLTDDFIPAPAAEPGQTGWAPMTAPPGWILLVLWRFVVYFTMSFFNKLRKMCVGRKVKIEKVGSIPPKKATVKRVIFVRHGQGAHNASFKNQGIVDPHLTDVGEGQVATLNEALRPILQEVELVAVSPITRALQTATGGFAGSKAKWAVTPLLREWLVSPCDTGRSKSVLLSAFPVLKKWEGGNDLDEIWWSTQTEWGLHQRIEQLEAWISSRPERTIAVVGHGGLFGQMLGFHLKNCGFQWVEWHVNDEGGREMV